MYSDLFDQLGRGVGGRRSAAAPAEPPEEPPLVALKAGKIQLVSSNNNTNSYQCTADPARGEIRLVWDAATNELQWQWYDRRTKVVQDRIPITNVNRGSTFARVPLADKAHALDRVYVWSSNSTTSSTTTATTPPEQEHRMYWMQDAEVSDEEELLVQKINEYLQDPTKATPEGTSNSLLPTSTTARSAAATAASSSSSHQVDALSSILENLGMPQSSAVESAAPTSSTAAAAAGASSTSTSTGALTLADLQGAMAGIAAASAATTIVPLQDLWTPQALDQLLSNQAVVDRLLPLLPESQQTVEHLRDNLQSPQVRHTLQALQQALLPDDDHNYSGYASVLANFQLDPAEGQALLAQGNPLAAFLECIVASVEKEKKQEQENSGTTDDDANMEEEGDGEDEETKDREAEA